MVWKFTGDRPVYQQIVEQIQGAVLTGIYPPGSRIPSVRELAAMAKVNPNTMQRALSELEHQKLLVGSGTAGRHVTSDQLVLQTIRGERLKALARECADKFAVYGIAPGEAAALLAGLEQEE